MIAAKDWQQFWRYPVNAIGYVFQPLIWLAPVYFMGQAFSVNGQAKGFADVILTELFKEYAGKPLDGNSVRTAKKETARIQLFNADQPARRRHIPGIDQIRQNAELLQVSRCDRGLGFGGNAEGSPDRIDNILGLAEGAGVPVYIVHLSAKEALAAGLANRVFPEDSAEQDLTGFLAPFRKQSPFVLRLIKKALRGKGHSGFLPRLEVAEEIFLEELMASQDVLEGLAAFDEKRPPQWKNR